MPLESHLESARRTRQEKDEELEVMLKKLIIGQLIKQIRLSRPKHLSREKFVVTRNIW